MTVTHEEETGQEPTIDQALTRLRDYMQAVNCGPDGSISAPLKQNKRLELRLTFASVEKLERIYGQSFSAIVQENLLQTSDRLDWAGFLARISRHSFEEAAALVSAHGLMVLAALIVAVNHFLNPFADAAAAKKKTRRQAVGGTAIN